MQGYVLKVHESALHTLRSSYLSFVGLAIFDAIMVDIFYPGLLQFLFHCVLFLWITVPVVFWKQSISNLFSFSNWCQAVKKNMRRYYILFSFALCEELSEFSTVKAESPKGVDSSLTTSAESTPVKEPPESVMSKVVSLFAVKPEEQRDLTIHEAFLDICKLIVFCFQALPVYAIVLGLESHIFSSLIYTLITIIALQFGIAMELRGLFKVKEVTELFDKAHFTLLPMALFIMYCIFCLLSKIFHRFFFTNKKHRFY